MPGSPSNSPKVHRDTLRPRSFTPSPHWPLLIPNFPFLSLKKNPSLSLSVSPLPPAPKKKFPSPPNTILAPDLTLSLSLKTKTWVLFPSLSSSKPISSISLNVAPPCSRSTILVISTQRSEDEQGRRQQQLEASKAMYLYEKPRPIDFYKEEGRDMMIEVAGNGQQQMILAESSGEDPEVKAPKKRAETWVQEETRSLISLRRDMDGLFNTSKSNKHLWEQISAKMRDKGFDRSPTMCTDKWRNLLKEFKKAKHQYKGSGLAKMSYYKELDELLKERNKSAAYKSPALSKVDSYMQFSDKGLEDAGIPYSAVEGTGRSSLNLERRLDHDGHPLAITTADAAANGVPPWNWRDTSANGGDNALYGGRVILVKWGEYTKKIGVDGTAEAIKEAIKSAFGLRTRRAFWLEDEDEVVRCLDREMPLGTYTLHLDEGVTVKVCMYADNALSAEDKTFYTGEDFRDFLGRNNWISLRELSGFRSAVTLDDLRQGAVYQGVRLLDD